MTAMLDELRRYLVAQGCGASGASTSATSIFVDSLPEWPGVSAVLALAQARPGDRTYGEAVPGIERPRIELLVRSTAPAAGQVPKSSSSKQAADKLYRAAVGVANQTLAASSSATGTRWLNVDSASGPPYIFDRDPSGRIYWRVVLEADREST